MNQEPPNTTELPPVPHADLSHLRGLFDTLLRHPRSLAVHEKLGSAGTLLRLTLCAIASVMVFGFVLGTFAYHDQLWAAPLKLGAALIFAGLICYPSLYIFSSLAGCRAGAGQLAGLLAGMLAMAGLLLLGFAPAVWIFTQGTNSFGFMGLLALASWLISLIFALRFLNTALRAHQATQNGPLVTWGAIFLLVTLQLTTTLRPILGRSEKLFNQEKKFFLQHWIDSADETLKP
ncbi:MAG TPA: hypothetical protein VFY13_03355 [Luteolibacter sp.]|nr:hypothetical protein [Luteolibacter sp.]